MKITLKKELDIKSIILKHNILLQATNLIVGREGVLQTEKELYLMLSFVHNIAEENIIEECNEDGRELIDIMAIDIEPFFEKVTEEEPKLAQLYYDVRELFLQRCKEIWDNQHSVIGVIDALLTTLATMSDEDKKEALVQTGKIAEAAFDRRTEEMKDKVDEANSKLEEFIKTFKEKQVETQENDTTIE